MTQDHNIRVLVGVSSIPNNIYAINIQLFQQIFTNVELFQQSLNVPNIIISLWYSTSVPHLPSMNILSSWIYFKLIICRTIGLAYDLSRRPVQCCSFVSTVFIFLSTVFYLRQYYVFLCQCCVYFVSAVLSLWCNAQQQLPEKFEVLIISNRTIFPLPWMVKKFIKPVKKLFHSRDEQRWPSRETTDCPLTSDQDVGLFQQLFSDEGDVEQKHFQQWKKKFIFCWHINQS